MSSCCLYCLAILEKGSIVLFKIFLPCPTSSLYALTAPNNILSLRLSKWPRRDNHAPAGEIWSVVHFPFALTIIGRSTKSVPLHLSNGSKRWRRLLLGSISTSILFESEGGATKIPSGIMNPSLGTSGAIEGGFNLNLLPSAAIRSSLSGLKDNFPPNANAIIISGLPIKFRVVLWPSLRPGKFLLNVVTIEFFSFFSNSGLFHCPIQGPHAFAKTVAPISFRESIWPSLSIVPLICSDPGVTSNGIFDLIPLDLACSAKLAALDISSYEELVQLPINATEIGST